MDGPQNIRVLLWDLDGTLACWESMRVVLEVASVHLGFLRSVANPLQAGLASARAFIRILKNDGPFPNDLLYSHLLGRSLGLPHESVAELTRQMTTSGSLDPAIRRFIRPVAEALLLVRRVHEHGGFRQIVATNPVMPEEFNRRRLELAGFPREWFDFVTGSESFTGQKRNVRFFHDLL
ncbi:MAG: hypothetical protein HQM09_01085, partial [Candidatus Riflebacteria bacterium]|nr:hypothetical protein [Candidatus Riflebacteria bacterium]